MFSINHASFMCSIVHNCFIAHSVLTFWLISTILSITVIDVTKFANVRFNSLDVETFCINHASFMCSYVYNCFTAHSVLTFWLLSTILSITVIDIIIKLTNLRFICFDVETFSINHASILCSIVNNCFTAASVLTFWLLSTILSITVIDITTKLANVRFISLDMETFSINHANFDMIDSFLYSIVNNCFTAAFVLIFWLLSTILSITVIDCTLRVNNPAMKKFLKNLSFAADVKL